jgi:murein tripeptide amidase MpaA
MTTRYFVVIISPNKQQLVGLQKFELDLFQSTVKSLDKNEFSIEGLITLDDVNRLVEKGYKVVVKKQSPTNSPANSEMMSFSEGTKKVEAKKQAKPSSTPSFTGYLSSEGIESAIEQLPILYPSISQLIILPEKTHEGRTSRAIKIGVNTATPKSGILFLGGVHAREIVNPDLLVKFAFDLCGAYTSNTGLTFGGKSYGTDEIKKIVENLELYIFPLVNPDGRSFVQSPSGDIWWRKNKNPNTGLSAQGVDINRNYDFLWDSGIGTSTNPVKETYRGVKSFSEPETRNVNHMINNHQNIVCVIDVHSYSELILYPWGDDENQTEDPDMNFKNPEYDGQRGSPGDSTYKEYIHKKDLEWYESTGKRIRNAIAATRGRVYEAEPGMGLYPTSGTCDDFVYSLRYNGVNKNITGFTIETGTRFQPDYSEAKNIMSEVSAGLVESCLVHAPDDTTP